MGSFSDYLENKILDHILGKNSYSMPTVYVALCTSAPTDASTGSNIVEPTGGSYARKATDDTNWKNATNGVGSNNGTLTFPTATGDWGTITHFAICDAATGGNMLIWGPVTPSVPVPNGSIVSFTDGNLQVTLD